MKALTATLLFVGAALASPALFACEPLNYYDWTVPAESGCVTITGPDGQPGSPALAIMNGCDTPIELTPVDCKECDVKLALQPGEAGEYTVNSSVGSNETVNFTIGWKDEAGANGTFSGAVRQLEGADDPCADDSALCSTTSDTPKSGLWLLLIGFFALMRRS